MQKLILVLSIFIFLFLSCNSIAQKKDSKMINVNVEEFKTKMKGPNMVVLDVRTPAEIAKGKIEGAIEIDIRSNDFQEKIQKLDKEKTYLVYCRSGRRSVKACGVLEKNGFTNLYNLKGGFNVWKKTK